MCNAVLVKNTPRNLTLVQAFACLLVAVLFGGAIELLQKYLFTWRSGEWGDLFADAVGAGMALFSVLITTWTVNYEKK